MSTSLYQYQEANFNSLKNYSQFLNWVSGEFDLFLQEETNGLQVYFPEGSFFIKASTEDKNIVAHIHLSSKVEKTGNDILEKIMSLHTLLLKIK